MTLAESRTDGVILTQGMETMARTVARRLRDYNEGTVARNLRMGRCTEISRSPVSRTARYSFMGTRGGSGHAALPCISARFVSVP